jgi:hypothetical protein
MDVHMMLTTIDVHDVYSPDPFVPVIIIWAMKRLIITELPN